MVCLLCSYVLGLALAAEPAGDARVVIVAPVDGYEILIGIDRDAPRDSDVVALFDGYARPLCVAPCELVLPAGRVDLFGRRTDRERVWDVKGRAHRGFHGTLPRGTTHFAVQPGSQPIADAGLGTLVVGASAVLVGGIFAGTGALVGSDDEVGRDFIVGGLVTMGIGAGVSALGAIAYEAARTRWKRRGPRASRSR